MFFFVVILSLPESQPSALLVELFDLPRLAVMEQPGNIKFSIKPDGHEATWKHQIFNQAWRSWSNLETSNFQSSLTVIKQPGNIKFSIKPDGHEATWKQQIFNQAWRSWSNLETAKDFMEQQQQGFSDSTPRAGSDRLQKSSKFSALQLMSISHISTQKYGSDHSEPIYITIKISPIGGRIRNHSVQSEHVLGILKLYLCLFQKNEIFFSYLFFLFCNYVCTYYQSNYILINNHL